MKHMRCAAILALSTLLFGCGAPSFEAQQELLQQTLATPFTAQCEIKVYDQSCSALFSRLSGGSYTLRYTSPALLNGYTLSLTDGEVTCEFSGASVQQLFSDYPAESPFSILCRCLEALPAAQLVQSAREENGAVTFDYGDFSLTANNAVPCALFAAGISIKFLSFSNGTA